MKTAVVLFNLGGPDRPESIRPFLFNLFNDPSIIRLPSVVRWPLAQWIAGQRARTARGIYGLMGGGSPILANTKAQAAALEAALADMGSVRVFIAMRYWHPMAPETAKAVKKYGAERVVLLPLYPQWSTTTTASSLRVWRDACRRIGLEAEERVVCCYPVQSGFVDSLVQLIEPEVAAAAQYGRPRILFSAHGLPRRVVEGGDPYQWQCERTVAAIMRRLRHLDVEGRICFQSRVGPLEWIGPATDEEIRTAGADGVPVVLVPIAFVSEHSETIVELDHEYAELARESGVRYYGRVATVGTHPDFIAGLATMVREAINREPDVASEFGCRQCPASLMGCGMTEPG